jgi:carboxymethylenebutenolidase
MKQFIPHFLICCGILLAILVAGCITASQIDDHPSPLPVTGIMTTVSADNKTYPAYLAYPSTPGKHPGIVLLHSFNGLEQGYKDMIDLMARDGFTVIAPEWQTYGQRAGDPEVEAVVRSSVAALEARPEVDVSKIGLTGFCAGGRYTMLFLPQIPELNAGVAFYGFPYSRGNTNNTTPVEHIGELDEPLLMIHGSGDRPSPIDGIYNYTKELDTAGKYYELKVYQGKPHGFMIENGTLATDDAATDAYNQMISFFRRNLE